MSSRLVPPEPGDGGNGGGGGEPLPPVINAVRPHSGVPGTEVALEGLRLGIADGGLFMRVHGYQEVEVPLTGGSGTRLTFRVPQIEALGAAGAGTITLVTGVDTAVGSFTVLHTQPPQVTSWVPRTLPENANFAIAGQRFGVAGAGFGVRFRSAAGDPGVLAHVESWTPASIVARVPARSALGGGGAKTVTVETPWGPSAPLPITVAEPPRITGISPLSEAGRPVPADTLLTISGAWFEGSGELTAAVPGAGVAVSMEVESWTSGEIRAYVPGVAHLRGSGERDIVVRTAYGEARRKIWLEHRGSITVWGRIEPHARLDDRDAALKRGMRAEIADAAWLLGRQWQLGEFEAEDVGSPVRAQVVAELAPLTAWRPGREGDLRPLPAGVPLEALVERERVLPARTDGLAVPEDRRLLAEAGFQLLRAIEARLASTPNPDRYRAAFIREYPLPPAEPAGEDPATAAFSDLVAHRVPDVVRLHAELRAALPAPEGSGRLPARPAIAEADRVAVLAAVQDWFRWLDEVYSQPAGEPGAWQAGRMEYAFELEASSPRGRTRLTAPEYHGDALDWHAFDRTGTSAGAGGSRIERAEIPHAVTYPGMPAPRWFELEDGAVDLGAIAAAPSDLLRLLLVEAATLYGNDWYTVPCEGVPLGSLVRVTEVAVTDSFGIASPSRPFAAAAPEEWRMFELAGGDGRGEILLPPVLATRIDAPALEEVALARDEQANMAWAIERVVASRSGRPLRRQEQEQRARPPERPAGEPDRPLSYRLASRVPAHWLPLLPRDGKLVLGAMRRDGRDPIGPEGRLLLTGAAPLEIADEEVPWNGVVVTRAWQHARWTDGSTHAWIGRRKQPGAGDTSSGLRFDVTEPP
jgi:hypothetical protein